MVSPIRHLRGLGIAIAVLGISAGAVFAGVVPSAMHPVSSNSNPAIEDPSESAEPTESPEASESAEPTESPEASDAAAPAGSPSADNHGALVSTAAQMPTPSGFPNHGAFVSCVAHLDVTLSTIDWTTVTPESCGVTAHGKSGDASTNGATHGAAGKAKGQANRAAHAPQR